MRFSPTPLSGAFLVDSDASADERGSFYRTFCSDEFESNGLPGDFVQMSLSRNRSRGTLRGLHYQAAPRPEQKLVRCVRGAAYDVIVDLRKDSSTFCHWFSVELSETNRAALFVPAGFAHGFMTLTDDTDILYQMTEFYAPDMAAGVRWNDPAFGIAWPFEPLTVSARDCGHADFRPNFCPDLC